MIFEQTRKVVDKWLEWGLVFLMTVSVLNVLWQVITRFIFANPSSFTGELARFLLIWLGLLGACYASGKKMHLAIDIVPDRMQGKKRAAVMIFIQGVVFLFALFVMVIGGTRLVAMTFALQQVSAALGIKLGYVYLVLPISGILIMFYSIIDFMKIPALSAKVPGCENIATSEQKGG